ncbi:MFS transporter [Parabacteroides faecis]|nr:MFS transporter [Parabacteroides faecis]
MGFVDIIGIATSYVKNDFSELTDSRVNLISFFCFLWFLILSIPTGLLMNKIGRKKTVLLSFLITTLAMCFPLINYSFISIIIAFALIGIGNTILQASLNPLVTDVVTSERLTGSLTLGQFIKAVSSFLGPLLTAGIVGSFLGWKMIFPIYAFMSLLALIWLLLTPVKERKNWNRKISLLKLHSIY